MNLALLEKIKELDEEVSRAIIIEGNKKYIPISLEAEFFDLVVKHRKELEDFDIKRHYLKLQDKIVDILLGVVVGGKSGDIKQGQMVYNAACTEDAIHNFTNIPYGGGGDLDHLYTHTGIGINEPDLEDKSGAMYRFEVRTLDGKKQGKVSVGPSFEVKDYVSLDNAAKYLRQEAGTNVFHGAHYVFIHIIGTNNFYIAQNKKDSTIYRLINFNPVYRFKQVKLDLGYDKFLNVKYF